MRSFLRRLVPELSPLSSRERFRCSMGAALGVLVTGLVSRAAVGDGTALPALVAPMGASAVLLFAVPASPLAQPWSIIGGNLVAAIAGVTAAALVPDPILAAPLALGAAVGLMLALRCLHPPSGAVALTAVLGGVAIRDLGFLYVLWPIAANSLLLLATALLFNNLTGRSYPHVAAAAPVDHGTRDPVPAGRARFASSDLDTVLKEYDQLLEVGRGDLQAILQKAEMRSYLRRSGQTTCADVMSRDIVAIAPGDSLGEALRLVRQHRIKMLPVTDETARVLGIVTQTDLLDKTVWDRLGPRLGWSRRLWLTLRRGRAPSGSVEDVMTTPVTAVRPETPIAEAVVRMSEAAIHHLPVIGADAKLIGIVSQSDLTVALLADSAQHERSPEANVVHPGAAASATRLDAGSGEPCD